MQSNASIPFKKWGLCHWQYISGYHSEVDGLPYLLQDQDACSKLFRLQDANEVAKNTLTIDEYKNICRYIIPILKNKARSTSIPSYGLSAIRVAGRLERILKKLEEGQSIWDVLSPYEVTTDGWKYKNEEAFLKSEEELKQEYTDQAIQAFKGWADNKSLDGWNSSADTVQNALNEIIKLVPSSNKLMDLLVELLTKCSNFRQSFQEMVKGIPSNYNEELIKGFLNNENIIKFLNDKKLLDKYLTHIIENKQTGVILLQNLDIFTKLIATISNDEFFNFLSKLSPDGNDIPSRNSSEENRNRYFKKMLMLGFEYPSCLNSILNNFSNYRTLASMLIYESLLRGDNTTAEILREASNKHEVIRQTSSVKNNLTNTPFNLLQAKETQKTNTEKTEFEQKIIFNSQEFSDYMDEKFRLTDDKSKLYFITHLKEFANELVKIGIMSNTSGFIAKACEKYKLTLSDDVKVKDVSSEDALNVRVQKLELSNTTLKEEVNACKSQISNLQSQLQEVTNFIHHLDLTNPQLQEVLNFIHNLDSTNPIKKMRM